MHELGVRTIAVRAAAALALVAVDGRLQLRGAAEALFLALVRVQVLHVPGNAALR